jgi:hypothetical protein
MLQLALARHPALFAVADVFETFIFNKPRAIFEEPVPGMLRSYLGGAKATLQCQKMLAKMEADEGPLSDEDVVRAFFWFAAQKVYAGKRPLEKTPSHVHSLPLIFSVFPQAVVLACVREPVDILGSYQKRLAREQAMGHPPQAWAWLSQSDEKLIAQLRRVNRGLRQVELSHPGRVFQVPYDWIIAEPEAALAEICTFIGLEATPALLQPQVADRVRVDARLNLPIGAPLSPTASEQSHSATGVAAPLPGLESAREKKVRAELASLTKLWRHHGPLPAAPLGPSAVRGASAEPSLRAPAPGMPSDDQAPTSSSGPLPASGSEGA